jgi:DnaK suppressor protein
VSPTKLDRQTISQLEQFLRNELARLQGSLRAAVEANRTAENPGLADMTAHASVTLDTEIQVTLVGHRTQQVNQIQDALERLAGGEYGFCQECDGFIGTARLRALPFAQRCRDCQSHAERRARQQSTVAAREFPPELEAA